MKGARGASLHRSKPRDPPVRLGQRRLPEPCCLDAALRAVAVSPGRPPGGSLAGYGCWRSVVGGRVVEAAGRPSGSARCRVVCLWSGAVLGWVLTTAACALPVAPFGVGSLEACVVVCLAESGVLRRRGDGRASGRYFRHVAFRSLSAASRVGGGRPRPVARRLSGCGRVRCSGDSRPSGPGSRGKDLLRLRVSRWLSHEGARSVASSVEAS